MSGRRIIAVFVRDLRSARRGAANRATVLVFYAAVIAVSPFALGPDQALLARIGPALIWLAALLSLLLSLDGLFAADLADGSLDMMSVSGNSLELIILAKCAALWIVSGWPVILATPFLALLLNIDGVALIRMLATLAIGTPALCLTGATGAALAAGIPRAGLLVPVLVLPISIPILIFSVGAISAESGSAARAGFLLLSAAALFMLVINPVVGAAALRFRG